MIDHPITWSLTQQLGKQVAAFVVLTILAALLGPTEFGIVGIAATWIAFLAVFSDLGFSVALVQKGKIGPEHLSSTFYLNASVGVILMLASMALSWPLAAAYRTPEAQPVIAALSIGFFTNSLSLTQIAVAQREFRFRDLAIRDSAAVLSGGVIGIALAFLRLGVWSLVAQSLVSSVAGAVLIWRLSEWRPSLREASWASIRELWSFSSKVFTTQLFKYLVQNSDSLLVGLILGPTALGIYAFAQKIVLVPTASLRGAVGAYLFPRLSRLQSNMDSVRDSYVSAMKAMASLMPVVLVSAGLLVPIAVPGLFGLKWLPAVPLMQVFVVVAIAQALISPAGELMKALDRADWLLAWTIGFTLWVSLCLTVGSFCWGIIGIGLGLAIANLVGVGVVQFLACRLTSLDPRLIVREMLPGCMASLAMIAAALLVVSQPSLAGPFSTLVALLCGLACYAAVLICLDRAYVQSLVERLRL